MRMDWARFKPISWCGPLALFRTAMDIPVCRAFDSNVNQLFSPFNIPYVDMVINLADSCHYLTFIVIYILRQQIWHTDTDSHFIIMYLVSKKNLSGTGFEPKILNIETAEHVFKDNGKNIFSSKLEKTIICNKNIIWFPEK